MDSLKLQETIKKYVLALVQIRELTQKPEGAIIKGKEFVKKHKLPSCLFIVLCKKYNIINRRSAVTEGGGPGYNYTWLYGDNPIDYTLAEKVHNECTNWALKTIADKTKVKQSKGSKPVIAAKPKGTVFTAGHLRVINKIEFDKPTEVMIDDNVKLYDVKRIDFLVQESKVLITLSVDKYVQSETRNQIEVTAVCSLEYLNKGFILSPRYESSESGAYVIKSTTL